MMILKEHNISVRLPQERAIDTGIVFVQNDKDVYKLNIRVFDGVNEIHYSEVESATITFAKSDGKVVQGDMQVEVDKLTYVLGTNEIAAPGKLIATIQLLGANERLTTARFLFRVEKDLITEDAVKSTSEFPILQKLKKELEEIDVVDLRNDLEAHLADRVSQIISVSRDVSIEGSQVISGFVKKPKFINIIAFVNGGSSFSIGNCDENGNMNVMFRAENGKCLSVPSAIIASGTSESNYTSATITINSNNTITLNWTKTGSGGTGIAFMRISAIYHGE